MRNLRLYCKRISLWIILALQVLLISSYFLLQIENPSATRHNLKTSVSFLRPNENDLPLRNKITYHTIYTKINLKTLDTNEMYVDFNSSLCYKIGTDIKSMVRSKSPNWKCDCLLGWHGNDCGQPEVIWRALLAYRKPMLLKGPRKYQRRIIYLFEVNEFTITTADIRISDLNSYIDLFVLYENETSNYFEHKLKNNFLHEYHDRILYIKYSDLRNLWMSIKNVIMNLKNDDIILVGGLNDIPNGLALQYLKLYDKWPEPVKFRHRWSVYGFFWVHPSKTILKGGASSISTLYETFNDKLESLQDDKTINFSNKGLIVGDLNHFGGWYCEFCYDSLKIIDFLKDMPSNINVDKQKIDNSYIEDLIENGIYLDGKKELVRTHRYQEKYYAPPFVVNNSWKYDWLLINLYSKMDYY